MPDGSEDLVSVMTQHMMIGDLGEFLVMIIESDGQEYVTFADIVDGLCVRAPLPDLMITDREYRDGVAESLLELGYILDWDEEQLIRRS